MQKVYRCLRGKQGNLWVRQQEFVSAASPLEALGEAFPKFDWDTRTKVSAHGTHSFIYSGNSGWAEISAAGR